jgi:(S)-ureidoglycine aminohydrolase
VNSVQHLGQTRSVLRPDHLLQTPDTFVRAALPGMRNAVAIVHASPAGGARFTQYTAECAGDASLPASEAQRFVYVLDGAATVDGRLLEAGGFAYLPAGAPSDVRAPGAARLAVIEKPYQPLDGIAPPSPIVGHEQEAPASLLAGDPWLEVRSLLPDDVAFDFRVNTMTYHPGASLPSVEVHVMEHGLLMLDGGGIYRLSDGWYPVTAGDFIWMAPYCPQWFGAIGKSSARYLIYKDWERNP